jgi:hypothetical protein
MRVYRLAENIHRRMPYCRTEVRVSAVSGSEVLVMFVTFDSEGEYKIWVLKRSANLSMNILY